MLYSGLDLHKRTIAFHTVDAEGVLVRRATLPTDRAAITAFDMIPTSLYHSRAQEGTAHERSA